MREFIDMPPAETVEHAGFVNVGHDRIEARHADDDVFLALRNPVRFPVERMVPSPDERTHFKAGEAEFFPQFAPQPFFRRVPVSNPPPGAIQKQARTVGRTDAGQQHFVSGRQQHSAHGGAGSRSRFGRSSSVAEQRGLNRSLRHLPALLVLLALRTRFRRLIDKKFPAIHCGARPRPLQVAPVSGSRYFTSFGSLNSFAGSGARGLRPISLSRLMLYSCIFSTISIITCRISRSFASGELLVQRIMFCQEFCDFWGFVSYLVSGFLEFRFS